MLLLYCHLLVHDWQYGNSTNFFVTLNARFVAPDVYLIMKMHVAFAVNWIVRWQGKASLKAKVAVKVRGIYMTNPARKNNSDVLVMIDIEYCS